jgi:hypothetical protein
MELVHEDYDLNGLWDQFRSSKESGIPYSIFDIHTRESFERWWEVIRNQGCSMPEKPPRYVCDFCCNCGEFRYNGIAALVQDDDSDDEDDDWLEVEPNDNVDELRKQIQRQNFELVYDADKNWMVYKYPRCRICWEREREFQQA